MNFADIYLVYQQDYGTEKNLFNLLKNTMRDRIPILFDETNAPQHVCITDGKIAQRTYGYDRDGFVFCKYPLTNIHRTWRMKIEKLGNWIAFGVAKREIVIKNRPNWEWMVAGHGSYLLSHNQWILHNEAEYNNKSGGFLFKQDEVVEMSYIHETKRLRFTNLRTKEEYELVNVPPECYPCVMFFGCGNRASIVD
jgi:hypothetical protein